jgi:small-conductance mechanosensitive channel
MDELVQQLKEQIEDYLNSDLIPELIALTVAILLGLLLGRILRGLLGRLGQRVADWTSSRHAAWLPDLLEAGRRAATPFCIWIMGLAASAIYESAGVPNTILDWVVPFFALWMIYRFLSTLIRRRMQPNLARIWNDLVLRPVLLIVTILQVFGLLDNILNVRINLSHGVLLSLGDLLLGLLTLALFVILARYLRRLLREAVLPQMGIEPYLIPIIATFSGYVIIAVGIWAGLSIAGVDLTALAFILGGLSVGLGFGLKELINNFISGFILLFERSLLPGDVIEVGQDTGVVEEIKLRATRIRTGDNVQLIVPNGLMLSDVVTTYSQQASAIRRRKRLRITVGVGYESDPHEVMAILLQATDHQDVLEEPAPNVLLTGFGESHFEFELRAWVADAGRMPAVSSALRLKIWDLFREKGITMPYPRRDLHIRSAEELPLAHSGGEA